jgi:hypothetical protein
LLLRRELHQHPVVQGREALPLAFGLQGVFTGFVRKKPVAHPSRRDAVRRGTLQMRRV